MTGQPTTVMEAYDLYLLGRHPWNKSTKEDKLPSIEYLGKAIQLDPEYTFAYSVLADGF